MIGVPPANYNPPYSDHICRDYVPVVDYCGFMIRKLINPSKYLLDCVTCLGVYIAISFNQWCARPFDFNENQLSDRIKDYEIGFIKF